MRTNAGSGTVESLLFHQYISVFLCYVFIGIIFHIIIDDATNFAVFDILLIVSVKNIP